MLGYELLPLDNENNKKIYYNKLLISKNKKELEDFISNNKYSLKELFPFKKYYSKQARINILNAYKYILKNKSVNKETLKKLHSIISKDLMEDNDNYYRNDNVYILNGRYNFDKAMNAENIEDKMNKLFDYINEEKDNSEIEEFIKSQIIHFYLVYVHPYEDMNGRTARTLAMWYLLNKNSYQYTIFNRAIMRNEENYLETIRTGRYTRDITNFINFMLRSTKKEIEIIEKPKIKLKKQ